jgi:Zn-dependent protease
MERRPFEIQFSLGPIPVVIEPSFWIIGLLMGFSPEQPIRTLLWVFIVFFSVLVHELGHALVARRLGASAAIRLYSFGGLTLPDRRLSRWGEVGMSLAGPFAGFLLGGGFLALTLVQPPSNELSVWFLRQLYWVNFGWGIINLFPVPPLDGGHVLMGVLGSERRRLALLIGGVVGGAVAVLSGVLLSSLYLPLLFSLLAFRNFQARTAMGRQDAVATDPASDEIARGWTALSSGNDQEAMRVGESVLEHAQDPESRNRARDLLAWVALAQASTRTALRHLERTEPPEAARALTWALVLEAIDPPRALPYARTAVEKEPSETAASLLLRLCLREGQMVEAEGLARTFSWQRGSARSTALGEVDFAKGEFGSAADHYRSAFEASGQAPDAYNAACSLARAGRTDQALEWLRRALGAGFGDVEQLVKDPDLASLRADPAFAKLVADHRPAS